MALGTPACLALGWASLPSYGPNSELWLVSGPFLTLEDVEAHGGPWAGPALGLELMSRGLYGCLGAGSC